MQFLILDRSENLLAVISNTNLANPVICSAVMSEEINKMYTLNLEVSTTAPESQYLTEENYLLFTDLLGNWRLFIIKESTETHSTNNTLLIYCEEGSQELLDDFGTYNMMGVLASPLTLVTGLLAGTRWEIGTISTVAPHVVIADSKNKSVLEAIQLVRDEFALQIKARYTVVGNIITHRYLDLMTTIGNDYGKRFEYRKDINSIARIVNTADLKTAIIGIGGVPPSLSDPVEY